jgi:hypothetical protein
MSLPKPAANKVAAGQLPLLVSGRAQGRVSGIFVDIVFIVFIVAFQEKLKKTLAYWQKQANDQILAENNCAPRFQ